MIDESQAQPPPMDPGPVLLLGAPGVGKGTQSQALVERYQVPHISTGDLLRENVRLQTSVGKEADRLMADGQLVPDDLVNKMVAERLEKGDVGRGYVLDGFPRTIIQAQWIDGLLGDNRKPVVALSIKVNQDALLKRITGRRVCPVCKTIYNVFSNPPKVEGRCDREGAALEQRPDDTEDAFHERMRSFDTQTAPVIDHYRRQGCFAEVDGEQPVEVVSAAVEKALERLRGRQR